VDGLRVATAQAVDTIFSHPAAAPVPRGCQTPIAQEADCSFGIGSTLLLMQTQASSAGGWFVEAVSFN